jgi:lipoprotein-anchoring transpeptidase ErfK/SrfK
MKPIPSLLLALAAFALSSCQTNPVAQYQKYDRPASLPTNPAAVSVKISTSKQMIYVLEHGKPLLVTPCNVGAGGSTPHGNFKIFNKTARKRANSHGWAHKGGNARQTKIDKKPPGWSFVGTPMPYWCEFKPNYGIHTGWVKHRPASHGCIRLHENIAPKFFRLVSVGTKVNIASSQPEDATLGSNIPRAIDAQPLPDYPASMFIGDGYFSRHLTPSFQ